MGIAGINEGIAWALKRIHGDHNMGVAGPKGPPGLPHKFSRVLNLKTASPEELEFAVRIDRKTPWGNPYRIGPDGDREAVIEKYQRHLLDRIESGEQTLESLAALSGRDLACWCAPKPCHGQVLKDYAQWAAMILEIKKALT